MGKEAPSVTPALQGTSWKAEAFLVENRVSLH